MLTDRLLKLRVAVWRREALVLCRHVPCQPIKLSRAS